MELGKRENERCTIWLLLCPIEECVDHTDGAVRDSGTWNGQLINCQMNVSEQSLKGETYRNVDRVSV